VSDDRGLLLILVRHGETVASSSVRLVGAGDVALSPLGFRQAGRLRDALRGVPLHRAATSAMERARATASVVLEGRAVPVDVIDDLNEVSFGEWEGLTPDEVCRRDPHLQAAWRSGDPNFAYPGGDSRRGFRERVLRGWGRFRSLAPRTGTVIVVAHKGVLRMLLGALAGRDGPFLDAVELGSISRVRLDETGGAEVLSTNEVGHLGADRVEGS